MNWKTFRLNHEELPPAAVLLPLPQGKLAYCGPTPSQESAAGSKDFVRIGQAKAYQGCAAASARWDCRQVVRDRRKMEE